jgi:hypothetical protein
MLLQPDLFLSSGLDELARIPYTPLANDYYVKLELNSTHQSFKPLRFLTISMA